MILINTEIENLHLDYQDNKKTGGGQKPPPVSAGENLRRLPWRLIDLLSQLIVPPIEYRFIFARKVDSWIDNIRAA